MSSSTQSDNPGETIRLAVERFRIKMESADRQFIQDRYDLGTTSSSESWNGNAPLGPVQQHREEAKVSRLEDLKTTFHQYMDGIVPSTMAPDEWREMFMKTFESVSNEAPRHDDNDDEDFYILRSDELAHFIKYANGVHDPDSRHSGISPWEPVPPMRMEIREYAYTDRPAVQALTPPDIAKAREELKESLEDRLLDENWIWGHCGYEFEVKVGFHTGLGSCIEHDAWYSIYMYCRQFEEDSDPSHKYWTWRVVIFSADIMNPTEPIYILDVQNKMII
ncbi:hypothetical protein DTO006G1_5408 [Penicillium roqueforti]|uniref:uncharacterized protein n=1 Tax=Penicillium roqueforti TaxID=5082 RepID=UPI00190DE9D7|nr:uncharacterized protein LCP9604111_7878 [Penicillium roqueforti]KAF9242695.1 hypothetical protein LCP9604111_7878 [Penicillium roqueforti]KAI1830599.1 hypothetical protein CBS147337_8665 [Penicillium roqueforti]KAI2674317.1 hypothetical protein CBS147355_6931 [Penicillium roqueforti]KAI2684026.1 hypothetical protein LCP963914a_5856 [Penicillium roqueforti]KAI2710646.1 hypothetical protein CBS147318_8667 [Penicillium roqueforti]